MTRPMTIGALRHRMDLERPVSAADGAGGTAQSWEPAGSVWGSIRPRLGREVLAAGKYAGRVTHDITLRYRADLLPNMRLRLGGRIFEIHAVLEHDEEKRWLICHCEEFDL